MKARNLFWLLALSASLLACGPVGRGGAPAAVASQRTFDLWQAWAAYMNQGWERGFTASGSIGGAAVAGSGVATRQALVADRFEGMPALRATAVVAGTLHSGAAAFSYGETASRYIDRNYLPLGCAGREHAVVSGAATIPRTARVGDAGTLYTLDRYAAADDAGGRMFLGTTTVSYALDADTAHTALMRIVSTDRTAAGVVAAVATETYRVTPGGALTALGEERRDAAGVLAWRY